MKSTCTHWKDIDHPKGGFCNHDIHKATVSFGTCEACPHNDAGDKWLAFRRKHRVGDKVANVTKAVGIKPCQKCKKRQPYLNGENV